MTASLAQPPAGVIPAKGDPVTLIVHSGVEVRGVAQSRVAITYEVTSTWYWDGGPLLAGGGHHGNKRNENITWIRGHHANDSQEVAALLAAFALVGLDW